MDKIVRFILLKLAKNHVFTILAAISIFANIDGPVTFLLYDSNDVDNDIQLILEFKNSLGKYHRHS